MTESKNIEPSQKDLEKRQSVDDKRASSQVISSQGSQNKVVVAQDSQNKVAMAEDPEKTEVDGTNTQTKEILTNRSQTKEIPTNRSQTKEIPTNRSQNEVAKDPKIKDYEMREDDNQDSQNNESFVQKDEQDQNLVAGIASNNEKVLDEAQNHMSEGAEARVASDGGGNNDNKNTEVLNKGQKNNEEQEHNKIVDAQSKNEKNKNNLLEQTQGDTRGIQSHKQNQSFNSKTQPAMVQKIHDWKAFEFLFPSGRQAKLIKLDVKPDVQITFDEILLKFKFTEASPVINLIGSRDTNRVKFYSGLARACFNTDAIIVDNAIKTGLEEHALRRGLKLIGVAPENDVTYPKLKPTSIEPNEISDGHTHLLLINNKEKNLQWGSESSIKINLCKKLAEGRNQKGQKINHKILNILFGESETYINELQLAVLHNLPILVVKGSQICDEYFSNQQKINPTYSQSSFGSLVKRGHFFGLNSTDPEDLAQFVHFFLTVTPY